MNVHPLLHKLIPILYEDEQFIAISKPAGVDVGGLPHEIMTSPGSVSEPPLPGRERVGVRVDAARITPHPTYVETDRSLLGRVPPLKGRGVLEQGLVELVQALRGRNETLHPANRLSRFESGVLLLGKNPAAAVRIRTMLKSFRLEQEYVAVVSGRMNKPMLVLDSRRGSPSEPRTLVRADRRTIRRPRTAKRPAPSAAPAIRTVLRRIEQGEHRTLVRCETTSPTTHALRAQLRSVGLRLVGDRVHDRAPRLMAHEDTCLHLSRVRLSTAGQKSSMTIRSPAPAGFAAALRGERDVQRLLHAALLRRLPCLLEPKTDSCRLLTGPAEGLSGLIAEKYGPVVVLQVLEASSRWSGALPDIARWYRDLLRVRAVYVKRYVRDRTQLDDDLQEALRSPKPLLGEPAPPQVEIMERGLRFAIRPYDGFSVGLFLDQRDNRSRIREMSRGKDVLNLFAYTCGFSAAAAVGGAKSTTSVDVSPKHLEWGRTNFALNGIDLTDSASENPLTLPSDPPGPSLLGRLVRPSVGSSDPPAGERGSSTHPTHQFVRSDAAEYLKRAKRQGKEFDVIILDPPSFAHGRKSKDDFSILEDLAGLVGSAGEVLRPGGVIMVSTNHRKLSRRGLLERVRQGCGSRRCEVLATPPLPPDFAIDPDHAKTVFVRLGGVPAPRQSESTNTNQVASENPLTLPSDPPSSVGSSDPPRGKRGFNTHFR